MKEESLSLYTRYVIAKENIHESGWFDTGCTITEYKFNVDAAICEISKDLLGNFSYFSYFNPFGQDYTFSIPDNDLKSFYIHSISSNEQKLSQNVIRRRIQLIKVNQKPENINIPPVDVIVDGNIFGWKDQNKVISVIFETPLKDNFENSKVFEMMKTYCAFQYNSEECVTFSDVFLPKQ